jgi:hypothetical protein
LDIPNEILAGAVKAPLAMIEKRDKQVLTRVLAYPSSDVARMRVIPREALLV